MPTLLFTPPFEQKLNQWLKPVLPELPTVYLVGGAVRDQLLKRPANDIDLICDNAEASAGILAKCHNAVMVPFIKKKGEPCFRVVSTEDHEDYIDFSPVHGGSLATDLARRDFTINAMAIRIMPDGRPGDLVDLFNGLEDLDKQQIRMTGKDVFSDDPLRMLRAFRFSAQLGFTITPDTFEAICRTAPALAETAFERITSELLHILKTPDASQYIRKMDDCGLLEVFLPEIRPMKGCIQRGYHHLDVWQHSLLVMENIEKIRLHLSDYFDEWKPRIVDNLSEKNRMLMLKLSGILHDIGKPSSRVIDTEKDKITFYGHQRRSGEIVADVSERLRLAKRDRQFLLTLVTEHMHVLQLSGGNVNHRTHIKWFKKYGPDVIPILIHGMADILSTRGPKSSREYRDSYIRWSQKMADDYFRHVQPRLDKPDLITGKDLIEMGMTPGPELGKMLKRIRLDQDQGRFDDRDGALALAAQLMGILKKGKYGKEGLLSPLKD